MRIQTVIQRSGLSKKTIHYYIEEGLINPKRNEQNGYYDFNEEDYKLLEIIMELRQMQFSINVIKDILTYPTLLNFFLHRHMNELKDTIKDSFKQLNKINSLIDTLAPNAIPSSLLDHKNIINTIDNQLVDTLFPSNNARMIAILIWAPFLDEKVGDYRHYLWEKISDETMKMFATNLKYSEHLIYNLSPAQIHDASKESYYLYNQIIHSDDLRTFENLLLSNFQNLIYDTTLREYWLILYPTVLTSISKFYTSNSHKLMMEYSDKYHEWIIKSEKIIKAVYKRINDDETLLNDFHNTISSSFNLTSEHSSDLYLLFTFHKSIYTKLPLEKLTKILTS